MEDILFFKSVVFLTALTKSDGRDFYLQHGFAPENLCEEVLNLINLTDDIGNVELKKYKKLIMGEMKNILNCLMKEGLIYYQDDLYYITESGKDLSKYMSTFSPKIILHDPSYPYRFYPKSNDQYGLN